MKEYQSEFDALNKNVVYFFVARRVEGCVCFKIMLIGPSFFLLFNI